MVKGTVLIFFGAALAFLGCGEARKAPSAGEEARLVALYKVERREGGGSEAVPGTVQPKLRAVIAAKVSGRISRLYVSEGQSVEAGAPLAEIDAKEIQAKLDQAVATRDQDERDLGRLRTLIERKAVAQAEFEAADAAARVARAAVEEAQAMLSYTHVTAPFAGVITRKLADVGDLAIPGKPLFRMEDPLALRFEAGVPESMMSGIKIGARLPVSVSSVEREAPVSEVSPVADPNTRTYQVKLDLPRNGAFRSGQFGHVRVPSSGEQAAYIPSAALLRRGQMEMVYVVDRRAAAPRAVMRLVRTGKRRGENLEILAGLEPGEEIVARDPAPLHDGQPVEVR